MQERQVLRRERLLFLGVTPRRGAEFHNLSLEAGDCGGQVSRPASGFQPQPLSQPAAHGALCKAGCGSVAPRAPPRPA